MKGLSLNRGSQLVPLNDLKSIPLPAETHSYKPVGHYDLANSIRTIGQDLLTDYDLVKEQYGVARQGAQMFAVLTFKTEEGEMGLSIGFRNSLDKSMSIGLAIGSQVFVCENLMMTGDIMVMKKHTPKVLDTLEGEAIQFLYRSQYTFAKLVKDSTALKAHGMNDNDAFKMFGLLFGHGVLSPRQLPVAVEQWQKPKHVDFQPRTAFSAYQAVTEALKTTPPLSVMEKHVNAHSLVMGEVIDV